MYFSRLKDLRNDRELNQEEIANILGVKRSTYATWESGYIMIPLEIADRLSVFYNVKLSYILGIDKSSEINHNKIEPMRYDVLLNNLLALKDKNKYSYKDIGLFINCDKSTCQRYFNGIVKLPVDRLIALSKLYKIDLDKLCGK